MGIMKDGYLQKWFSLIPKFLNITAINISGLLVLLLLLLNIAVDMSMHVINEQ